MKKILICFILIFTFLLVSCDFKPNNNNQDGYNIENNNKGSDDNKELVKKDIVHLYSPETIRSDIKLYSHIFLNGLIIEKN